MNLRTSPPPDGRRPLLPWSLAGIHGGADRYAPVLGVVGFFLALGLGLFEVWKTLWRKSKFDIHIDWIQHAGGLIFSLVVANIGQKKDSVLEIRLQAEETPPGLGWFPFIQSLPVVLDVDVASSRFGVETNSSGELPALLRKGKIIRAVVVYARRDETTCEVGPPPES